jgi:hypothetical protein
MRPHSMWNNRLTVQGATPRLGDSGATAGCLDPNAGREARRGNRSHRTHAVDVAWQGVG